MSRIEQRFAELKARGEKAMIAYLAAGDPDLDSTYELVLEFERQGVDVMELGLAFSDPIADGPAIQQGSQRALAAGSNTAQFFDLVRRLRSAGCQLPIIIMTYYNLLLKPGLDRFVQQAAGAGVDGLIIPDLPYEEEADLRAAADRVGIDLVRFMAPTSTDERLALAGQGARGFVYLVSLTGVTGARTAVSERVAPLVERARRFTDQPLCVGFGISSPEHVRYICQFADGVIVGSALVQVCGQGLPRPELVRTLGEKVGGLKAATRPQEVL